MSRNRPTRISRDCPAGQGDRVMSTYRVSDDGASDTIEADDMESAKEAAADLWQDGSWDSKCLVDIRVAELDEDGDETGEVDWVQVECGDDPVAPDCTDDDGHEWVSPHSVVGGLDSNPGVWSKGGTTIVTRQVCQHCGLYRRETSYGAQRNPGQCDTIEYLDPDETSLAYVDQQ